MVICLFKALIGIETPLGKPQGCIVDCSRKGVAGSQTKVSFSQVSQLILFLGQVMISAFTA